VGNATYEKTYSVTLSRDPGVALGSQRFQDRRTAEKAAALVQRAVDEADRLVKEFDEESAEKARSEKT
jgi:hypothetical protein